MSVSRRKRWLVLDRDAFTCRYCGRSAPSVPLEVDHIVPRSQGGKDNLENLAAACFDCNRGKRAQDATEPLQFMEYLAAATRDSDRWLGEAIVTWERAEQLERAREMLVYELAYRTGQAEADILDWLIAELAS